MAGEMLDRVLDRTVPLKAQVAVARSHRLASDGIWLDAGAVNIELLTSEPVGPRAASPIDEHRSEHIAVKRFDRSQSDTWITQ